MNKKLFSLIFSVLLLGGNGTVWAAITGDNWATDPANCVNGIEETSAECPIDQYQCNTTTCSTAADISGNIPATGALSSADYGWKDGGTESVGGYVYHCLGTNSCMPSPATMPANWFCQEDSTCVALHVTTECEQGVDGKGGHFSCDEGIQGETTNCMTGYTNCDTDTSDCEILYGNSGDDYGTHVKYESDCDPVCHSSYLDCNGTGTGSDGACEVQKNVTPVSGEDNVLYATTCSTRTCADGYFLLSGDTITTDGCDGVVDEACTVTASGLPGECTGAGSTGVVTSASPQTCACSELDIPEFAAGGFVDADGAYTQSAAMFTTSDPLVWGVQEGTGSLLDLSNGTNSFVVDNDANVGIGAVSPGAKLDIKGAGTTSSTYGLSIKNSADAPVFVVRDDGDVRLNVNDASSVLSAKSHLNVEGTIFSGTHDYKADKSYAYSMYVGAASTISGGIKLHNGGGSEGTGIKQTFKVANGEVEIGALKTNDVVLDDDVALYFSTAEAEITSEKMRITGSGNVGIGTTSPTAALHLKAGTATASTAPLKFTSGINLTTPEAGVMEFDGTDLFFTPDTTRKTFAFLESPTFTGDPQSQTPTAGDNDASIATTAFVTGALGSISSDSMTDADSDTKIQVEESTDEDKIRFDTAGTERMIIDEDGNVGIGAATPAEKLDIEEGNIRLDSSNFLSFDSGAKYYHDHVYFGGNDYYFQYYDGSVQEAMRIDAATGNVGIGTTTPSEKLEIAGNLKFSSAASIESDGMLTIGDGTNPISITSTSGIGLTGDVSATGDISATGTVSATGGFKVGSTTVIDNTGMISGDRVDEVVAGRSTYASLNDRFNGVIANYSSILSNATVVGENFMDSSKVKTANTTAYYNNQLGTIQNDHSAWETISLSYGYGSSRSMGGTLIYGNKMYLGTYGYGIKIINLDTETIANEWWTASTPSLPNNYWQHLAYDPVRNDLYATNNSYDNGMIKIDIDSNTVTQFTTSNSDLNSLNHGTSFDSAMEYYDGKIYTFPTTGYMQVYDVLADTFTDYGSVDGLVSGTYYASETYGNELHLSTSNGFYIWDMDTDTLIQHYDTDTTPGINTYHDDVYSSFQDPLDSDIVWLSGYNNWQKLSKTTGSLEFHKIIDEIPVAVTRWDIARINNQIWLGAWSGMPYGYLVYDLTAQEYFIISDTGKVTGNAEETSSYHWQPHYYNGYWYFSNYSDTHMSKSQLIFEASNTFETETLATSVADFTMAKFDYSGGAGAGDSITWYLTADGGSNWEGPVTPGSMWEFTNIGTDLRAKATMVSGSGTSTPVISGVTLVGYDGATWAGQGSTTVETEVLEARNSSASGIFGSVDLRLEDIETDLASKVSGTHNHDSDYLQLTGGTLSGILNVDANVNANNLLPNATNAYDLGSGSSEWQDLFLSGDATIGGDIAVSGTVDGVDVSDLAASVVANEQAKYVGRTPDNYNGSLSFTGGLTGYKAAHAICDDEYTGSHMCSSDEIFYTISSEDVTSLDGQEVWISTGAAKFPSTDNTNDCDGWTFSGGTGSYGNFWKFDTMGGVGKTALCSSSLKIACCK